MTNKVPYPECINDIPITIQSPAHSISINSTHKPCETTKNIRNNCPHVDFNNLLAVPFIKAMIT